MKRRPWDAVAEPPAGVRRRPAFRQGLPVGRRTLSILAGVALFYAAAFAAYRGLLSWTGEIRLEATPSPGGTYARDGLVPIRVSARGASVLRRWKERPPRLVVAKDGRAVESALGDLAVLRPEPGGRAWSARWPVPWNAAAGTYEATLAMDPALEARVRPGRFEVTPRPPRPFPAGMFALAFDEPGPWAALTLEGPDGSARGWEGLLDWAEYAAADALWLEVGPPAPKGWEEADLELLPLVARAAHRRGLKVGAWLDGWRADPAPAGGGERALDLVDGAIVESDRVSWADPARRRDVRERLARLASVPGVDFVGLAAVGHPGGYELAAEFFRELRLEAPEGWNRLSGEARAAYLARRLQLEPSLREPWRWWRSRRAALELRAVVEGLGKPVWVFQPGPALGRDLGQDAAMMSDAGADLVAVELFPADAAGFNAMAADWRSYGASSPLQLAAGEVLDWDAHQRSTFPPGPEELFVRLAAGAELLDGGRPARALFATGLSRALSRGRDGPYSVRQWVDAARRAAQRSRDRSGAREDAR